MTQNWQTPPAQQGQGAVFVGPHAVGPAKWIRFERRWWTWITSPYKSMYPWGMGIRLKIPAIIWLSGGRHTDKQHAHYMLKQEFNPDPPRAEGATQAPPSAPYHHPRNRKARL